MQSGTMRMVMAWLVVLMITMIPLTALAADPVTIDGQVNDNYQVVGADGQVYEVADTAEGNDLVENHIGEKVKVTGTMEMDQDVKIITVTAFQILAE